MLLQRCQHSPKWLQIMEDTDMFEAQRWRLGLGGHFSDPDSISLADCKEALKALEADAESMAKTMETKDAALSAAEEAVFPHCG